MTAQKLKNLNNQLVNWLAFRKSKEAEVAEVKETIKDKTEAERTSLKPMNRDLKVAKWKIDALMKELEEKVETSEEMNTVLTLDDFDVSGVEVNIELARAEFKESQREENED